MHVSSQGEGSLRIPGMLELCTPPMHCQHWPDAVRAALRATGLLASILLRLLNQCCFRALSHHAVCAVHAVQNCAAPPFRGQEPAGPPLAAQSHALPRVGLYWHPLGNIPSSKSGAVSCPTGPLAGGGAVLNIDSMLPDAEEKQGLHWPAGRSGGSVKSSLNAAWCQREVRQELEL